MTRRHYIDSSGLAKLVNLEAETSALRRYVDGAELLISTLTQVEVGRAALRGGAEAEAAAALAMTFALSIDDGIIDQAAQLRPDSLRSLDAIQLATALRVRHDIDSVICYDKRLAEACRRHGLRVEQPA